MRKFVDLVGTGREYPDPRSLQEIVEGRYRDSVYTKPEESRYHLAKAPDPNPFVRR